VARDWKSYDNRQTIMAAIHPLGPGLVSRRLLVHDGDVVWLRSVVEGYEGLAVFYGDGSGIITLAAPLTRARELDELIDDLRRVISMTCLSNDE
jgi:hypothetical protein